ncbi:MAG: hypothetical protein AB7T06_33025 [Kofleriaceae bacterium]
MKESIVDHERLTVLQQAFIQKALATISHDIVQVALDVKIVDGAIEIKTQPSIELTDDAVAAMHAIVDLYRVSGDPLSGMHGTLREEEDKLWSMEVVNEYPGPVPPASA